MKKTDSPRKDSVRDEILHAAFKLFYTFGMDRTTMENIAGTAGKSKVTLYSYFKSKEDVFLTITSIQRDKAQREIEKAVNSCKSATERLRAFFSARENILITKSKLYPILVKDHRKHIKLFNTVRHENDIQEINLLKQILLEGVASGEFKNIKRSECDVIARTEIDYLWGRFQNQVLAGKKPKREHGTGIMEDIFLRGIR